MSPELRIRLEVLSEFALALRYALDSADLQMYYHYLIDKINETIFGDYTCEPRPIPEYRRAFNAPKRAKSKEQKEKNLNEQSSSDL